MAGPRIEDDRLLRGGGRYGADVTPEGVAAAAFLRSPMSHARLLRVDASAARAMPGVLAVLTGADLPGFGRMAGVPPQRHADGRPMTVPEVPPLATDRVRFVGHPIALVVAETLHAAQDAAEAVEVEYEELPAVTGTTYDPTPAAPVWDHAPDNLALDFAAGDMAATEAAFAAAAHVVRAKIVSQRLVVCPMEPRSVVARFDAAADRFEMTGGSQGAAGLRDQIAALMGVDTARVRVVSGDVGGGFGAKTHVYPEYAALLEAARRIGRAVRWTATRSESFLSDTQGRDSVLEGELALDGEGRFLAVRLDSTVNTGAYQTSHATFTATSNLYRCLIGVYRTPAISLRVRCLYTNTVPTAPYRGAGRPEANAIMERLVEAAARQTGIDAVALRRRNLIGPAEMPYAAPNGLTYDSGDFPALLDRALALADHAGFPARREAARREGRLRGLGIACYLEIAGGTPFEDVRLELMPGGVIEIRGGMQSNGQGHATVFPRLVARELGIDPAAVRLGEGDSDLVPEGTGSVGSRSMTVGGAACLLASARLVEVLKERAAPLLEADAADLAWEAGRVVVAGTDRGLGLAELAARLGAVQVLERARADLTFPNGCHVAELEVEPTTGDLRVIRLVAVDDIGRVVDHTLAHGQVQGGIAQGLGQILGERAVYDPETGQPLTASFMDYGLPRAEDLPAYVTELVEVPCRTNPLGTKGAGEAGTTGAFAAGYNALLDALAPAGIAEFPLPATPPRIWACLQAAGG
ncbi:xanthine dehydrogenase family protein molybdopterin-binding subunit [Roseomonas populi]|uniref:Xanthine dehydrogenase family protein molybdopterin-binding subunit n=1 Tax=Roseomonas populi TaxID=3121582 RepID=A0ABT1X6Q5_9PROT|nr:xanthine dehydrogenase family protein molybdopterin-binding subunit [Roseomonas pecuniae]MCR0983771.1 xanthine dehydrogenase family protein molybdopterin-binding subunit [Roseomonas pecuniae]